jgi:hypothetical protein
MAQKRVTTVAFRGYIHRSSAASAAISAWSSMNSCRTHCTCSGDNRTELIG